MSGVSKVPTPTFKYKIIDTINKGNPFPPQNFYYYDKKDIDYDKDKLVFSKKGYLLPTIDTTHEWTYTDNFKYLDKNCEVLIPLFNWISSKIKKSGFSSNKDFELFSRIKRLDLDKDIYKQLGIEKILS